MLTSSPRNVVTTSTRFLSLSLLVEIQRRATSTHHRDPRRPSLHDVPLALSMAGGGPRTRRIRRTQTLHGLAPFPQSHIFPALRHVGKPPTLFPPHGRPHSHTDARLRECLQLSVLWLKKKKKKTEEVPILAVIGTNSCTHATERLPRADGRNFRIGGLRDSETKGRRYGQKHVTNKRANSIASSTTHNSSNDRVEKDDVQERESPPESPFFRVVTTIACLVRDKMEARDDITNFF